MNTEEKQWCDKREKKKAKQNNINIVAEKKNPNGKPSTKHALCVCDAVEVRSLCEPVAHTIRNILQNGGIHFSFSLKNILSNEWVFYAPLVQIMYSIVVQ